MSMRRVTVAMPMTPMTAVTSKNALTADGSYMVPFLAIAKPHSFQVETSNPNCKDKAYQANGSCRRQQNGYKLVTAVPKV